MTDQKGSSGERYTSSNLSPPCQNRATDGPTKSREERKYTVSRHALELRGGGDGDGDGEALEGCDRS